MKQSRLVPLALVLLAVGLAACAGLGLESPGSFNDRVGYALSAHTGVLQSTTAALDRGELSSEDAVNLAATADNAREAIDSARRIMAAGDVDGANRTLGLATAILAELQAYLRE